MLGAKSILVGSLFLVWQLGCGGGSLRDRLSPVPKANVSISPDNAISGGGDLTLTITGSQTFSFFSATHRFSQVVWSANGSDTRLATSFVSGSELTAIVPATLLVSPVQSKVRVEIWDLQGDAPVATSSSVSFQVASTPAPAPSISSISPSAVSAGSPDVTITIDGGTSGATDTSFGVLRSGRPMATCMTAAHGCKQPLLTAAN